MSHFYGVFHLTSARKFFPLLQKIKLLKRVVSFLRECMRDLDKMKHPLAFSVKLCSYVELIMGNVLLSLLLLVY